VKFADTAQLFATCSDDIKVGNTASMKLHNFSHE